LAFKVFFIQQLKWSKYTSFQSRQVISVIEIEMQTNIHKEGYIFKGETMCLFLRLYNNESSHPAAPVFTPDNPAEACLSQFLPLYPSLQMQV